MNPDHKPSSPHWQWAVPAALLGAAALLTFWGLYTLDHLLAGPAEGTASGAVGRYLHFDPESLTDAYAALATVLAAVLGLVIMVVSIIVQLSSDRYTGVARLFLRDPVNRAVMGFYVVGCVTAIWLSMSLKTDFTPRVATVAQLLITTLGLVLMAPYFGYVFWFLDPRNIVVRLRQKAVATVRRGAREPRPRQRYAAQASVLNALEELTDITINSISGKDKIIASAAVDALKDLGVEYLACKREAGDEWFRVGPGVRSNPDFVAMDPEVLEELERRRTWVEWKILRQYLGIFYDALPSMRDINYLIAIDTRYLGEAAAEARDEDLVQLVFRYMNSYLRSTLNARDVRTAYHLLNQYRLLIEAMLRSDHGDAALQGARHMSYYGQLARDMTLPFVTETVAYDLGSLCEYAHERRLPEARPLLELLLELGRTPSPNRGETVLAGIRKAQAKLAAFYLMQGDPELARRIGDELVAEPRERLHAFHAALQGVTSKEFWEITERGRHFDYLPADQRAALSRFFASLDGFARVVATVDGKAAPLTSAETVG
jgi:hypothetical protein